MYQFLSIFIKPFCLGLVILVALILWQRRKRRGRGRRWTWLLAFALLFAFVNTEFIARPILGSLEWRYPRQVEPLKNIDAIVVLSSGLIVDNATGQWSPDPSMAMRLFHAVEVYHQSGPCPIILTGGRVGSTQNAITLAAAMRDLLVGMGIPESDLILEDRSRTTYENGLYVAEILQERKLDPERTVLVTSASHMRRSELCFQKLEMNLIPSACNYRVCSFQWRVKEFLPQPYAAEEVSIATHEWVGIVWYWLQGRI